MSAAVSSLPEPMFGNMRAHYVANFFPLMEGKQFSDFVEDIRQNGLQEPIITYQGEILDGRNRFRACETLDVAPRMSEWRGAGSATAFVISKNLHRRHLSESQRAMIAARVANAKREDTLIPDAFGKAKKLDEPIGSSREKKTLQEAAELLNVGRQSVVRARAVLTQGTQEEIKSVEAGRAAVSTVAQQILERRKTGDTRISSAPKTNEKPQLNPGHRAPRYRFKLPENVGLEQFLETLAYENEDQNFGLEKITELHSFGHTSRVTAVLVDAGCLMRRCDRIPPKSRKSLDEAMTFLKGGDLFSATPIILDLARKIWGVRSKSTRTEAEQRRVSEFKLACVEVTRSCVATAKLDIPNLDEQQADKFGKDLRRAADALRTLQTKLKEIWS